MRLESGVPHSNPVAGLSFERFLARDAVSRISRCPKGLILLDRGNHGDQLTCVLHERKCGRFPGVLEGLVHEFIRGSALTRPPVHGGGPSARTCHPDSPRGLVRLSVPLEVTLWHAGSSCPLSVHVARDQGCSSCQGHGPDQPRLLRHDQWTGSSQVGCKLRVGVSRAASTLVVGEIVITPKVYELVLRADPACVKPQRVAKRLH